MSRSVAFRGVDWQVEGPDWPFWDEWERGEFEPLTLEAIDRLVRPGSTFVDVGAWIGPFSMWAAQTAASVIAVEPDPAALRLLRRNIDLNGCDNIVVHEGAVNETTGLCHIEAHENGWGSAMTHLSDDGLRVDGITMPDLFDLYEIDDCSLVKVDIEGAEAIVLRHVAPFLASVGTGLLVAMHGSIGLGGRPVDYKWFDVFSNVTFLDDNPSDGWKTILALP